MTDPLDAFLLDAIRKGTWDGEERHDPARHTTRRTALVKLARAANHTGTEAERCLDAMVADGRLLETREPGRTGRGATAYLICDPHDPCLLPPDARAAKAAKAAQVSNVAQSITGATTQTGGHEARDPKTLTVHPENALIVPSIDQTRRALLRADIERTGAITTPLTILPNGQVLAGHERLKLALELGLDHVPVVVRHDLVNDSEGQIEEIVLDNFRRKEFTQAEKIRLLRRIEPARRKKAEARRVATQFGGDGPGKSTGTVSDPPGEAGEVRKEMGRLAGLSASSWSRATRLLDLGDAGKAPVAQLYELALLKLDRAHRASELPLSVQTAIVNEVLAAETAEQERLARDRVGQALADHERAKPSDLAPTPGDEGPDPDVVDDAEVSADDVSAAGVADDVNHGSEAGATSQNAVGDVGEESAVTPGGVEDGQPIAPMDKHRDVAGEATRRSSAALMRKHLEALARLGDKPDVMDRIASEIFSPDQADKGTSGDEILGLFERIAAMAGVLRSRRGQ